MTHTQHQARAALLDRIWRGAAIIYLRALFTTQHPKIVQRAAQELMRAIDARDQFHRRGIH